MIQSLAQAASYLACENFLLFILIVFSLAFLPVGENFENHLIFENSFLSTFSGVAAFLPFYLEVSESILSGERCVALTHLKDGLANLLNKTPDFRLFHGKWARKKR